MYEWNGPSRQTRLSTCLQQGKRGRQMQANRKGRMEKIILDKISEKSGWRMTHYGTYGVFCCTVYEILHARIGVML